MIERSLISVGNNYRTKRLLEKAANGGEVTIAYIGGSITEGYDTSRADSYVNVSFDLFTSGFAGGNGSHVHLVNAGMSGTPSTLGLIRFQRDVLKRAPTPPDLVVVEFAVNDDVDPTNGATYESLVREILEAENAPAVILLFSVIRSGWNLQDRFIPIGEQYRLPMISIKDAVIPELKAGNLTEDEFFRDQYHPTVYGFKIMADCLIHYFSTVRAESKAGADIILPQTPVIGTGFRGIRMIDAEHSSGVVVEPGSFTETDTAVIGFNYDRAAKTFPHNWRKKSTVSNNPFRLTLTCRNLFIVYKRSQSTIFGTALVFVDGSDTPPATLPAHTTEAWNNPWTALLFDNKEAAEHTVEVRMADDSRDKCFTIMAFGYSK
jgi:lysophospholipase L1-like esterase